MTDEGRGMCPLPRGVQNMSPRIFHILAMGDRRFFVESPRSREVTKKILINSGFARFCWNFNIKKMNYQEIDFFCGDLLQNNQDSLRGATKRRSRVRILLKPWFFQASSFQLLKAGSTWEPYFGWVLCFECKYLVHLSSNQESLCSSHISTFWAVL